MDPISFKTFTKSKMDMRSYIRYILYEKLAVRKFHKWSSFDSLKADINEFISKIPKSQ